MTNTEIKKAFEQFKKELFKETGIKGGFTMNAKQIENRTATYAVCPTKSFESAIEYFENWIKNNPKSAQDAHCAERIEYFKELRNAYGTRANYIQKTVEKVTGSKAFEKFSKTIGGVKWHGELGKDYCGEAWYYIRFTY